MSTRSAVLEAFKRCRGVDEALLVEIDSPLPVPIDRSMAAAEDVASAAKIGLVEHVHLSGTASTSVFRSSNGPSVVVRGTTGALGAWRHAYERHRSVLEHLGEVDE